MATDQKQLLKTFNALKKLLKPYQKNLKAIKDLEGRYELEGTKSVEIAGRKKDAVYWCGIIIQSTYVGIYFMPIYSHKKEFKWVSKETMKMLTGKSCFHIKDVTPELKKELTKMFKKGYQLYKKEGWV